MTTSRAERHVVVPVEPSRYAFGDVQGVDYVDARNERGEIANDPLGRKPGSYLTIFVDDGPSYGWEQDARRVMIVSGDAAAWAEKSDGQIISATLSAAPPVQMEAVGQQLVARIKRSSKYYGQTTPNEWFDVSVCGDRSYRLRGNSNNYRISDVVFGIRLGGEIVELK